MKRREFITLLGGAAVGWPLAARAQQSGRVPRIGYLAPAGLLPRDEAFRQRLQELGYVEGKNIVIENRLAEGKCDRLPALAEELVRLEVDVIVTVVTQASLAAKHATKTIPIVIIAVGDPLGTGLVASLARPGGNVTGMSLMAPDLGGKRLELLKELLPRLSRVSVLWNAANPYSTISFKETQAAGRTLGVEIQSLEVRGPDDFDGAFEAAKRQHPDGLITVEDPLTGSHAQLITDFVAAHQMPALHGLREFVTVGGLMSYGASLADLVQRSAGYIDKILGGAKPADLPVQQPSKFELVINLKTAKALGLEVPPTLLARADEVIE